MIAHLHFLLPFLAALGTGIMAGIFFAFSAFMMTALGRLPPPQGIAAIRAAMPLLLKLSTASCRKRLIG